MLSASEMEEENQIRDCRTEDANGDHKSLSDDICHDFISLVCNGHFMERASDSKLPLPLVVDRTDIEEAPKVGADKCIHYASKLLP